MDDRDAAVAAIAEMRRLQTEHSSMVAGEIWHLVDAPWAAHWLTHIGLGQRNANDDFAPAPGPVENSKLQGRHRLALSTDIQEHKDFIVVHDAVWNLIMKAYGGGPDFPREVVTTGVQLVPQLELHPLILRVLLADSASGEPDPQYVFEHPFSSKALVSSVVDSASTFFYPELRDQPGGEEYRLWRAEPTDVNEDRTAGLKPEWILIDKEDLSKPLIKFELRPEDVHEFLLEMRVNNNWPRVIVERDWRDFRIGDIIDALDTTNKWYESTVRDVKADTILVHYNNWESKWDEWIPKNNTTRLAKKGTNTNGPFTRRSTGTAGWSSGGDVAGIPVARGVVGLRNLGNTCFMNSTLQCLIQCPILTDFFLDDIYLTQLNRANPLGWQGKVAETYAQMVKDYWSGELRVFCPRELKQVIGEFQPRFRGYQQQDSQELLSFLLDALHEDLNRIKDKPLTNAVESDGRPDSIVAEEAWRVHKLRNDSIITDCMQGQVKSTLVCPKCRTVGITFDPYSALPLALPVSTTSEIPVQVVHGNGKQTSTLTKVTVDKSSEIQQLIEELSKTCGIPSTEIVLCDVYNNTIFKIYKPTDTVDEIRPSDDTWAFHLKLHHEQSAADASATYEGNPGYQSDEEGAIRSDRLADVPTGKYAIMTVSNYVDSATTSSELEQKKNDPLIAPFPVELPCGVEVSAETIRNSVLEGVAKFTSADDLGDVKIVLSDRLSSGCFQFGANRKEIGQDIQSIILSSHTAFQLVWPTEKAEKLIQSEPEKASSPVIEDSHSESALNLNQCFNIFTKEETLSSQDAWRCPSCKVHVCASKRLDIWRIPQVLVIQLKRFQYSGMWRNKIMTMIDFPLSDLCLDSWTPNPAMKGRRYDLFAVSNHFGSLGGGHYTAFVKNLVDGKWYNMDDSLTTPIEANSVITEAAYVLFYALKST